LAKKNKKKASEVRAAMGCCCSSGGGTDKADAAKPVQSPRTVERLHVAQNTLGKSVKKLTISKAASSDDLDKSRIISKQTKWFGALYLLRYHACARWSRHTNKCKRKRRRRL